MNISKLLACFTAAALLVACSDQQESSVGQVADEAKTATETVAEDVAIAAEDVAITKAAEDETAAMDEEEEAEAEEEAEEAEDAE